VTTEETTVHAGGVTRLAERLLPDKSNRVRLRPIRAKAISVFFPSEK
jgi:hypothetical protein